MAEVKDMAPIQEPTEQGTPTPTTPETPKDPSVKEEVKPGNDFQKIFGHIEDVAFEPLLKQFENKLNYKGSEGGKVKVENTIHSTFVDTMEGIIVPTLEDEKKKGEGK